jgi:hypothetical protein
MRSDLSAMARKLDKSDDLHAAAGCKTGKKRLNWKNSRFLALQYCRSSLISASFLELQGSS